MDSRAVFYKDDFICDDEVIKKAKEFGEIIKKKYNLKKLKVSAGLKKGEKGEIWSSIMKVNGNKKREIHFKNEFLFFVFNPLAIFLHIFPLENLRHIQLFHIFQAYLL